MKEKKEVEKTPAFMIESEPPRFVRGDLDVILAHAAKNNTSDVSIQTNEQIHAEIYGKFYKINKHRLSNSEVEEFACKLYGSESARSMIKDSKDLDGAYEVKISRTEKFRFRYNITAIQSEGNEGIQVTCRTIPVMPPELSKMNVEQVLIDNFAPKQGIICVTGATGSGKSTLLAAIIRHLAEDPNSNKKILTYESPIEFVYDEVNKPTTLIAQTEIPKNLPDFAHAIRNALRRKPAIILIGEARDAETIGEAITASMTGHLVYTTVHSNGVADTVRRMVNVFPEGEKNARAVDLISSLKMIVSQMLLPSTDGKRVPLREYLVFDQQIVDKMMDAGIVNLTQVAREIVQEKGRTFFQDAKEKYKNGILGINEYNQIKQLNRGVDQDIEDLKGLDKRYTGVSETSSQTELKENNSVARTTSTSEIKKENRKEEADKKTELTLIEEVTIKPIKLKKVEIKKELQSLKENLESTKDESWTDFKEESMS